MTSEVKLSRHGNYEHLGIPTKHIRFCIAQFGDVNVVSIMATGNHILNPKLPGKRAGIARKRGYDRDEAVMGQNGLALTLSFGSISAHVIS